MWLDSSSRYALEQLKKNDGETLYTAEQVDTIIFELECCSGSCCGTPSPSPSPSPSSTPEDQDQASVECLGCGELDILPWNDSQPVDYEVQIADPDTGEFPQTYVCHNGKGYRLLESNSSQEGAGNYPYAVPGEDDSMFWLEDECANLCCPTSTPSPTPSATPSPSPTVTPTATPEPGVVWKVKLCVGSQSVSFFRFPDDFDPDSEFVRLTAVGAESGYCYEIEGGAGADHAEYEAWEAQGNTVVEIKGSEWGIKEFDSCKECVYGRMVEWTACSGEINYVFVGDNSWQPAAGDQTTWSNLQGFKSDHIPGDEGVDTWTVSHSGALAQGRTNTCYKVAYIPPSHDDYSAGFPIALNNYRDTGFTYAFDNQVIESMLNWWQSGAEGPPKYQDVHDVCEDWWQ